MPHALLLKYPGTNCDAETERALRAAGFSTQIQPIATATPEHVAKSQLVVLGGGFSYGDYVTSGRLAQLETERFLGDALHRHHAGGGLLLGICNGFQILTKLGILPDSSLIDNKKERFECVWAKLVKVAKNSPSSRAFRMNSSCPPPTRKAAWSPAPETRKNTWLPEMWLSSTWTTATAVNAASRASRIPPAAPWA